MVRLTVIAVILLASSASTAFTTVLHRHHSMSSLFSGAVDNSIEIPPLVESPVLALVYPALIAHKEKYGNPNIPLGSTDGKRCKTLRRLHFQNKLSDQEAEHLSLLGFRFHSFEDVYYECEFDEMFGKLLAYHNEFQTFQIPKKYEPDPELGGWVTMLRRLNEKNELPQVEIDQLDEVGFAWISTRKCGSSFMAEYRDALSSLSKAVESSADVRELLQEESNTRKWIEAQRRAHENGKLPASRVQYMDDLPGIDWKDPNWARSP